MFSNKVHLNANKLVASWLLNCCLQATAHAEQDPFAFDLSGIEQEPKTWQWSGFVQSRLQKLTSTNDLLSSELMAHLQLKGEHQQWRSFISLDVQHDNARRAYRNTSRAELKEAFIIFDGNHTDISIGKQRVAWSVADGVSTIDRLNAIDLRDPIGNARTASRRPSWLIRLEHNTEMGTFETVWLPRGKDRTLPEFNSPWESEGLHQLRSLERSSAIDVSIADPEKDELGLRYLYYGQGLDWSLAWFNGYSDAPIKRITNGNKVTLTPIRSQTYNASVAIGLAQSTIRAELAYTPKTMHNNTRTHLWQGVAGWDRTFDNDLYINLQIFYNHYQMGSDDQGITFAITSSLLDDAATAGVRGQLANDQQKALETFIDYDYSDHIKIGAKWLTFDGSEDSALGNFQNNDYIEFTLRWEI